MLDYIKILTRRRIWTIALLTAFLTIIWTGLIDPFIWGREVWPDKPEDVPMAPELRPQDLMQRPVATGAEVNFMPKYIHQSWRNAWLSPKMTRWSRASRSLHPDWQWTLWTDDDNLSLVQQHFPWFLDAYNALPNNRNRADAARSMYMYLYGGIYADLDVEFIRPFDGFFRAHLTPPLSRDEAGKATTDLKTAPSRSIAFFGRMDYDGTEEVDQTLYHTIPNAWMAATPGHPFFLLVLENLKSLALNPNQDSKANLTAPGALTGSVALYRDIHQWMDMTDKAVDFDKHYGKNPSYALFKHPRPPPRITLLAPKVIFPFASNNAGKKYQPICQTFRYAFNSKRCKAAVATKDTYAISYWSNMW